MRIADFLQETKHRPHPIPQEKWLFYQEWNELAFLHYEIDVEVLKAFVPKELEIDCYQGKAWVSHVSFCMESVHPRNLFPIKAVSDFNEINIRTYVKYKGKSGVYFISIEAGKKLSAFLSRKFSGLPYRYSPMEIKKHYCAAKNDHFGDSFELEYSTSPLQEEKSELDRWLTERYAVFHDIDQSIVSYNVHHIEWTLENLKIEKLQLHYPRFQELFKAKPDKAHYAAGIQVVSWNKNV